MQKKHSILTRSCSLILAILLFCSFIPMNAAAVDARASYYLSSYQAYVYPAGSGEIQVWFNVTGVDYMDEIGALSIHLYESTDNTNWTYKKTFRHSDYSGMLDYDDIFHSGHVSYQGVKGRYYKAYVCIWAGKGGDGDTRYFWTSAKQAT